MVIHGLLFLRGGGFKSSTAITYLSLHWAFRMW